MIQQLSTAEEATEQTINKTHDKSTTCFEDMAFCELGLKSPILIDLFKTTQKRSIFLLLFPTCLVQSPVECPLPETRIKVCTFTFNTTFFISLKKPKEDRKYCALKLLNMDDKRSQSFYCEDDTVANKWGTILINYINQIGIQEYYKTIRHLGKGVSADVYLAERISDKKEFAIKVFSKDKNNEKIMVAFINELKIMRLLSHCNIVKLYGVFVSNEFIYAILEYLSGGNLYEEIKAKKKYVKEEQTIILSHLMEGVQHLRLKRIVHRDLKLQNILIRRNGEKKDYVICDFGLATWLDEKSYIFEKCGTPGYIAPEILRLPKDEKLLLTNKVDMFSLGSIFHVILLLRPVFVYESDFKVLLRMNKKAEIDWKQSFYKSLSKDEMYLLQTMLESNPDKRLGSDTLLKLDYFKRVKDTSSRKNSYQLLPPKTENIQEMVVRSNKLLRNVDQVGGAKVKEERQTSLKRDTSINSKMSLEAESAKLKSSSFFDIFRRKKTITEQENPLQKKEKNKTILYLSNTSFKDNKDPIGDKKIRSSFHLGFNKTQA